MDQDGVPMSDDGIHATIATGLISLAVPIGTLRYAPDNARLHADAGVDALAMSLRLHGQQKPVVAKHQYRGQPRVVLAGNGTLQAAHRLGWSHLAVIWFEGSDDDARQYAIRDNRTQELSTWDATQLASVAADGVDLLALWHDDAALADLLHHDVQTPRFETFQTAHRLDELQPHCRSCTCRKVTRL